MTNEEFINGLKVINDSTRLLITQMLSKNETMCACKILEELNITQGTLSHHMKVMVSVGLITCERDGKWCHYTLAKCRIKELASFLEQLAEPCSNNDLCGCR